MKKILTILILNIAAICTLQAFDVIPDTLTNATNYSIADSVVHRAEDYIGCKYRRAAIGPKQFDCSGFTHFIFSFFGYNLPRSAQSQYTQGFDVDKEMLAVGDLVFFSGRKISKNVGHVGIVVDVDEEHNTFKFIHACSRGVIVDTFSKIPYYQQRYIGARRIL